MILVAPDRFKNTFSAREVARHLVDGVTAAGATAWSCPLADGGEGTLNVLLDADGGWYVRMWAHGPWGDVVGTGYAVLQDGTAVVEAATASGMDLPPTGVPDPESASTAGTGEVIVAAARAGARRIVVTTGGSLTVDGGLGALEVIEDAGGLGRTPLIVLCDVRTGFVDAARVQATRQPIDPDVVDRLTERLRWLTGELPRDPSTVPGSGAGGGLAGGLWAMLGAEVVSGAEFVLDAVGFDQYLTGARAVILGEGLLGEAMEDNVVNAAARRAMRAGVDVHLVVGAKAPGANTAPFRGVTVARDPTTLRRVGSLIAWRYDGRS